MKSKFLVTSAIMTGLMVVIVVAFVSNVEQQSELDAIFGISSEELEKQIRAESGLMMIDIRNTDSYMLGHIEGSAVDDLNQDETLDKRISTIHSRIPEIIDNIKFVIVDEYGSSSTEAIAQRMTESGLETSLRELVPIISS